MLEFQDILHSYFWLEFIGKGLISHMCYVFLFMNDWGWIFSYFSTEWRNFTHFRGTVHVQLSKILWIIVGSWKVISSFLLQVYVGLNAINQMLTTLFHLRVKLHGAHVQIMCKIRSSQNSEWLIPFDENYDHSYPGNTRCTTSSGLFS